MSQKLKSFPILGVNIKNVWNHHLAWELAVQSKLEMYILGCPLAQDAIVTHQDSCIFRIGDLKLHLPLLLARGTTQYIFYMENLWTAHYKAALHPPYKKMHIWCGRPGHFHCGQFPSFPEGNIYRHPTKNFRKKLNDLGNVGYVGGTYFSLRILLRVPLEPGFHLKTWRFCWWPFWDG